MGLSTFGRKHTYALDENMEIDCPYCNAELDLSDHDKNRCFSGPIFNNRSDDLVGETVNCPDCEKEFIIENVGF
ncbi:MAG TPA: hypothetical protein EYP35_06440 [Desulfobacterales bacterium]|nr:hypothetical protein [Desulfobacterales bacterium]